MIMRSLELNEKGCGMALRDIVLPLYKTSTTDNDQQLYVNLPMLVDKMGTIKK